MRASRMASVVRSARWRAGPELVVYPSLKTRYRTCMTTRRRSGRSASGGSSNRMPEALRELGRHRERRMAAEKDKGKGVVGFGGRSPAGNVKDGGRFLAMLARG